jgi:hypothetical protein
MVVVTADPGKCYLGFNQIPAINVSPSVLLLILIAESPYKHSEIGPLSEQRKYRGRVKISFSLVCSSFVLLCLSPISIPKPEISLGPCPFTFACTTEQWIELLCAKHFETSCWLVKRLFK